MQHTERARRRLCAALAAALLLASLAGCSKKEPEETVRPKIQYATEGVTEVEDPAALQKAVDEMVAQAAEGSVTLEYRNDASSDDGTTFTCYIGNAAENTYDMFIAIYGDAEFTDELYVSGLIKPGTAFNSVTLDKALDPGSHTVYVAFTQVEADLETIHTQTLVTMQFTVAS